MKEEIRMRVINSFSKFHWEYSSAISSTWSEISCVFLCYAKTKHRFFPPSVLQASPPGTQRTERRAVRWSVCSCCCSRGGSVGGRGESRVLPITGWASAKPPEATATAAWAATAPSTWTTTRRSGRTTSRPTSAPSSSWPERAAQRERRTREWEEA